MKLNLLPQQVSQRSGTLGAWVICVLLIVLGVGAAAYMITSSSADVAALQSTDQDKSSQEQRVVSLSASADTIIQQSNGLLINASLAKAMSAHCDVYPDLYDSVLKTIPSFFRVTSIQAAPAGDQSTVVVTGTLRTYREYADIMLALLRSPDVVTVSRTGFQVSDVYTPNITADNPKGEPQIPGQLPLPADPIERLRTIIANGGQPEAHPDPTKSLTFTGTGGFGQDDRTAALGAMPGESLVTLTIVVKKNLQAPSVRANLAAAGAGSAAAAPATGGGSPFGPGGPGGPPNMGPGGPGGPAGPGSTPSAPGGGGGKKRGAGDDSSD